MFQSSPDLVVGRYACDQVARAIAMFQSSPDLVVGRYVVECLTGSSVQSMFQSSPDLVVGRYGISYKA